MIAAKCFDDISSRNEARQILRLKATRSAQSLRTSHVGSKPRANPVETVLDFENRDWRLATQPGRIRDHWEGSDSLTHVLGALRRIIMNIFGTAQKYTEKGFIRVTLRTEDRIRALSNGVRGLTPGKSAITLIVQDTGRGISGEYLQHRLYTPFAQDDTFASGVGLGLSIV